MKNEVSTSYDSMSDVTVKREKSDEAFESNAAVTHFSEASVPVIKQEPQDEQEVSKPAQSVHSEPQTPRAILNPFSLTFPQKVLATIATLAVSTIWAEKQGLEVLKPLVESNVLQGLALGSVLFFSASKLSEATAQDHSPSPAVS